MRSTGKWNWAKPLLLFPILSVTNACVTASTVPVASSYCRIAKPITYDATKDTPDTVRQVEAHNSQWVCLCEQDCPAAG